MANRNTEVAQQLDAFNVSFREGEWGRLELDLSRPPSEGEKFWVIGRTDGVAFHLKGIQAQASTMTITFQKGVLQLGLIALILGALGIGVLSWKLFSIPSEALFDMVKAITLPLGMMLAGGYLVYAGRDRLPPTIAGIAIAGGGFFLAWRQLIRPEVLGLEAEGIPDLRTINE